MFKCSEDCERFYSGITAHIFSRFEAQANGGAFRFAKQQAVVVRS